MNLISFNISQFSIRVLEKLNSNYLILSLVYGSDKKINTVLISKLNFLYFNNEYIFKNGVYKFFKNWMINMLTGFLFNWIVRFSIVGYHYTLKFSRLKRLVRLKLGFRYRIVLVLPTGIDLIYNKRRFCIVGDNIYKIFEICKYIRNLRNLFPYKSKGFVYVLENLKLKAGKKSKLR